ncbi:heavy metal translocating P-type ATPase [Methyloversatilis discipulorum]|uniref:heavy metal translocating P-type ATPase n=1 Tax=Methyloversatilis discipulorum TaxID=1119528 RepID=UPI003F2EE921
MSEHARPASTGPANKATDTCGHCACSASAATIDPQPAAAVGDFRLHIPRMDCAVEEQEIRALLADIEGIRRLGFRLAERTLTLDANEDAVDRVTRRLREAGFPNERLTATPDAPPALAGSLRKPLMALGCALAAELVHLLLPDSRAFSVLGMGLAALAIALAGLGTYRNGLRALRDGKLNMNALMGIAVTGAFLIGQWPEAAMVMALYALAELIEARSVDRARDAVRTLLDLAPPQAAVEQPDGSWLDTPVAAVPPGARVRVRPGSRIPVDGVIEAGHSAVNQSPVTGESLPVDKTTGDTVFAGTINETGLLDIRVTRAARDTTLARIIHAVEQAQASRAPTQRFVDRFAAIYTPLVFAGALAVALLAPFVLGMAWMEAIYTALVLLVIACPCALVLSTPVTIVSGLASAARKGVLIKGGSHLEAARRLRAVALDKTGTLTEGRPRLVDHDVMPDVNAGDALNRAALLAGHSDHPVSQAIAAGLPATATEVATEAATETADDSAAERFTALPGRGVSATIGGREWVLGNHRLIEERGLCSPALEQRLHAHEAQGHTVTLLADDERVHALFAVADRLRPHSAEAVAALKSMGVAPVMLSGDNADTARTIAAEAGIEDARGDLLPEDKLAAIDALRSRYGACAMVGDGINDAPALARADIGIAMGGAGTDTAMEAADIVIMNDDLRRIPDVIRLSRRTHAVLWQNIALAIGIKAVFMVLALRGDASMWMAVFADMGASLIVVANGLRLSRH